MNTLMMMKKEWKELLSSYKILFVPIVFTILMMMQPITMKMLPDIIEGASGLPEGTVIEIPEPTPIEAMSAAVTKFSTLGIFVLIMITMGTIAGERSSGVAAMVFSKPISRANYYFAKVFTYFGLTIFGILIAVFSTAYYVEVLFGELDWLHVFLGTLLYIPTLLLVIISTICASGVFRNSVTAGGVSLVFNFLMLNVPQLMGDFMEKASPEGLTTAATYMIEEGSWHESVFPGLAVVGGLIIVFFFLGWYLLEKQEI